MHKLIATILGIALILPAAVVAESEDLNQIFSKVNELVAAKNYTKALEELSWASKEIEKRHTEHLRTYLPDELAGFKGSEFEANAAFGITNVEREYRKGSEVAKVSLTGGSAGAKGPFAGLAGLGSMAAMMGAQGAAGQDTFRLDGRTANLNVNPQTKRGELTVFLNSGSILKIEMPRNAEGETLKGLAKALNLNDLDTYLGGAS